MAATSVVVLDRGNNTTCTVNLHGKIDGSILRLSLSAAVPCKFRVPFKFPFASPQTSPPRHLYRWLEKLPYLLLSHASFNSITRKCPLFILLLLLLMVRQECAFDHQRSIFFFGGQF
uniref:Uncharacterized protein n=1 Tax=Anopheles farauti TaxID=69004 RepID=A0A182QZ46_9DIPT